MSYFTEYRKEIDNDYVHVRHFQDYSLDNRNTKSYDITSPLSYVNKICSNCSHGVMIETDNYYKNTKNTIFLCDLCCKEN